MFFIAGNALALENPEQKVAKVIKDYVVAKQPEWSKDEIQVTFKLAEKTFEGLKAYSDAVQIKVLEVYPEFKPVGSVVFPLLITDDEGSEKILLRAKVEVMREIAAAAATIKKGKMLEASDVKFEVRDVALLPPKYFVESVSLAGKEAKIGIPKNSTLFEWMVGEPPLVRRGANVSVTVSEPGLMVRTRGEAMEDGYRNAEIKVKRADSKKMIVGKVISPSEVEVKL
jgi:flagella basal body P-ring formation protein FlgA